MAPYKISYGAFIYDKIKGMFDLVAITKTAGYVGLFLIVFAESGVFLGFFLPGDSLLFTAGFLSSQNFLNIFILIPILFLGAVLGDNFGYAFGKKVGPRIFRKEDSLIFHKDHVLRAQKFYEKYGKKTIVLARFFPIVRTFAPILAGVGGMHYPTFLFYNVIGGAFWTLGLTLAGFFFGRAVPDVDRYVILIVIIIIFLSAIPALYHLVNRGRK